MELDLSGSNIKISDDMHTWEEVNLLYNAALKQIQTKIEILNEEFQEVHRYNPIEHVKARVKGAESIVKKLKRNGYESTIENMVRYVNDIAGIRIICSFTSDIYRIAEMISSQKDIQVLTIKDYIMNPKDSGYRSYHMIVSLPVYLSDRIVNVKVEIQIRTVAMDFWASLEHKIKYKYPKELPENIFDELKECSYMINELDKKMSNLGGNLIEEFEQDLLFNKDLQSKEIKMPDCYTTQVINKIIDSF